MVARPGHCPGAKARTPLGLKSCVIRGAFRSLHQPICKMDTHLTDHTGLLRCINQEHTEETFQSIKFNM